MQTPESAALSSPARAVRCLRRVCGRVGVVMHACMGAWWWVVGAFLTLFGRTAEIMVKFDPKCSLETHHDRLVFYGDKQGTRVLRTYAAWLLQPC